jgi:hypothetical protein
MGNTAARRSALQGAMRAEGTASFLFLIRTVPLGEKDKEKDKR